MRTCEAVEAPEGAHEVRRSRVRDRGSSSRRGTCRRAARASSSSASQLRTGASGACTWTTSKPPARSSRRIVATPCGVSADVRDRAVHVEADRAAERDQVIGQRDALPGARPCGAARSGGSRGRPGRARAPRAPRRATPPPGPRCAASRPPDTSTSTERRGRPAPTATIFAEVPHRHFVKYTFLKLDPAWRRLDAEQRAIDKREFAAACADFAEDHLLRAFSLMGTRGDADLMLLSPGGQPRPHPRLPRRAGPERPDEVVLDPLLVPRDDQGERVLRRVAPRGPPRPREVPLRLPLREDARLVRARRQGALADHAGAHQGRPRVPERRPEHVATRSGSTTRSSSSPSRPTIRQTSSTSSSGCGRPSRRPTPCATPRPSRASRPRSSAR